MCFFLLPNLAQATTYYVSDTGVDINNGTSSLTPWKTLAKLDSAIFSPGDSILFKKGDTFYGSITISQSGTAGNPITFSSYGTGAQPIITGFTDVTTWTNLGNNIWESTNAVSSLDTVNMVTVGGVNTAMGRYPNNGYLYYQSHTTSTITSSDLSGAFNWAGAELAFNNTTYTTLRVPITNQSGSTLTFTQDPHDTTMQKNGLKFIIQNDARTLDQQNEWYYNPTTHTIKMYSIGQPSNVKVSTVDTLVNSTNKSFITFDSLDFTGSNMNAFLLQHAMNHTITNSNFKYNGNAALYGNYGGWSDYLLVENCTFDQTQSTGMSLTPHFRYATIRNNTISNTGMIYGAASYYPQFSKNEGIAANGEGSLVEYNTIINTGYIAIHYRYSNTIIQKNYIYNYSQNQNDGGAIYTWNGDQGLGTPGTFPEMTGIKVLSNIIINNPNYTDPAGDNYGVGDFGIYLDYRSNGIEISDNTIDGNSTQDGDAGIFLGGNHNILVQRNTTFNNSIGLRFYSNTATDYGSTVSRNNIFVAKTSNQLAMHIDPIEIYKNEITADNNIYARPIDDNITIEEFQRTPTWHYYQHTLSTWQTFSGQDTNSHKSPVSITNVNDLQFEYNAATSNKTISLSQPMIDMVGNKYASNVTLAPYTSVVLIKDPSPAPRTTPTTFYVSTSGSDTNNGTSSITPWQTLAKVNASTFIPGDSILFKKGNIFYGSITVSQSGAAGNPITFSSYGTGAQPIITGFTDVTAWTNLGNNIWESTSAVSTLSAVNMVTVGGINTAMGRYPNADAANGGYLKVDTTATTTSLTSSSLTGNPNWTGAEVVTRSGHFLMGKSIITSQSGSTLNFNAMTQGGPSVDFGFFIQNDVRTLDQQNEWYYNSTTHKLRMYSTSQPTNVKVASTDRLVTVNSNYLTFNDIAFTGANEFAFYAWDNNPRFNNVAITNSSFLYMGISAVYSLINYLDIENNTIFESNGSALSLSYGNNLTVKNNDIRNIGVKQGMKTNLYSGSHNSAVEVAISNNLTIEANTIVNTGYNAIAFYGDNILVKNNFINTFCTILDDGGGIYTFTGNRTQMTNAKIIGNIVINGKPDISMVPASTEIPLGIAPGIYLDERSKNVEVANNSVANTAHSGIFINSSAGYINVHNNTVYNASSYQYYSTYWGGTDVPPTANQINGNIFVSKLKDGPWNSSGQKDIFFYFANNDAGDIGTDLMKAANTLNNNYYARLIGDNDGKVIRFAHPQWDPGFLTLTEWQTYSGQDLNSHMSTASATTETDIQFEYNAAASNKTVNLSQPMIDVSGTKYASSVTLTPYTAIVLIKDPNPAASSGGGGGGGGGSSSGGGGSSGSGVTNANTTITATTTVTTIATTTSSTDAIVTSTNDGSLENNHEDNGINSPTRQAAIEGAAKDFVIFEENLVTKINQALSAKLAGRLLLQVESHGEAWYLNPANKLKYYLGTPAMAFSIMRSLGQGISNVNLNKIKIANANIDTNLDTDGDGLSDVFEDAMGSNKNKVDTDGDGYNDKQEFLGGYNVNGPNKLVFNSSFVNQQAGKIFLQVESHGEAWYVNPLTKLRYYLGRPEDAYSLMRNLSLGISNDNLRQLKVGEIK